MISILIPVYNEEESVAELHKEVLAVLPRLKSPVEIIFIDDGSTDGTLETLLSLSPVRILTLRRNFGKTVALDAGVSHAQGSIIVTLDGDGQNDPNDIPAFIQEIEAGSDAVVGWRAKRLDPLGKRLVSRGGYAFRRVFLGSDIHDSVCGLQAYRKECFEKFDWYGDIHRFIPDILDWQDFKVTEIKINHRPRRFGETKYSSMRMVRGFLDMLSVIFWKKYRARPFHVFGSLGIYMSVLGTLLIGLLFILRSFKIIYLARSIWPFVGFFFVLAGIQLFVAGILADVALKNHHGSTGNTGPYRVKEFIVRD